jgi:hypothetical protein
MPFTEAPPPPPGPSVAVIDPKTGLMTRPYYDWLQAFVAWTRRLAAAIP